LGWMMPKRIWSELGPRWTHGFWDDWLREPEQRKGRSCIFPEVNRVYTFGEHGSSGGLFFQQYLAPIKLNTVNVPWHRIRLDYLSTKPAYDEHLRGLIANATTVRSVRDVPGTAVTVPSLFDPLTRASQSQTYVVEYSSTTELDGILRELGMMVDHKAGIPRGSYQGVLPLRRGADRVLLKPSNFPRA